MAARIPAPVADRDGGDAAAPSMTAPASRASMTEEAIPQVMTDGKWTRASEAVETFRALQRAHRSDGVVTAEEAAREEAVFAGQTMPAVVDAYDCTVIGLAVLHGGPEAVRPRRLIRQRERRLADAARFGAPTAPEAA